MARRVVDIHRSRVPRLEIRTPSGDGPKPDAIAEAMETRKEILGGRILDQTQREIETDIEARKAEQEARVAEARAKLAEAQTRLKQLESAGAAQGQQPTQQTSDMMVLISDMLDTFKTREASQQQRLDALQEQLFAGQVQQLAQQIADLKQEVMSRAATGGSTQDLSSKIEEVKQAQEALAPFFGQVPQLAQTGGDINTLLLMHRIQGEHEIRLAEIRANQEDKRWGREMDWERFKVEKQRTETLASALNRLAPTISRMADDALSRRTGVPVSGPAASASQQVRCQKEGCPGVVEIALGQEVAQCPVCQTQYQVSGQTG